VKNQEKKREGERSCSGPLIFPWEKGGGSQAGWRGGIKKREKDPSSPFNRHTGERGNGLVEKRKKGEICRRPSLGKGDVPHKEKKRRKEETTRHLFDRGKGEGIAGGKKRGDFPGAYSGGKGFSLLTRWESFSEAKTKRPRSVT